MNKNGWGYRDFIIGGSILLIALIVATFFVMRLYSSLMSAFDTRTYEGIEIKLNEKSLEYINSYYKNEIGTGVITVSTDNLLKYKLITEENLEIANDKCEGYSLIRKEEEQIVSSSYIKCKEYETAEYQGWRVGK